MSTSPNNELGPASFTAELNLWQVWNKARRIPTSGFNLWATVAVFAFVATTTFFSSHDAVALIGYVRELAQFGFNAAVTVLGFLVAGFTIFASVSNPNMLIEMGSLQHPKSGLSWMKHSFFVLLRAFIYYIIYAVICFFVVYLGVAKGPISFLLNLTPHPDEYALCLAKVTYVVLVVGQFFLLMQLKSFIFNVYSGVVANLRYKAENGY